MRGRPEHGGAGVRRPARTAPVERLARLAHRRAADVDAAIGKFRRLVVVGEDADLATVLARLLRADRLGIEIGYAPGGAARPPESTGCGPAVGRHGGRGAVVHA
ncbi:hypothetical protein I552_7407 [Mycobacterium xenopi 3993]|nr:hypothetical protein I552_7407 [Mycobacterium xenopi 3993]